MVNRGEQLEAKLLSTVDSSRLLFRWLDYVHFGAKVQRLFYDHLEILQFSLPSDHGYIFW